MEAGDREALIKQFMTEPREKLGAETLKEGNTAFERLSHLLAYVLCAMHDAL